MRDVRVEEELRALAQQATYGGLLDGDEERSGGGDTETEIDFASVLSKRQSKNKRLNSGFGVGGNEEEGVLNFMDWTSKAL